MNLFCFSLEGSSDSLYEPAYSRNTTNHLLPDWQSSPPLLRTRARWRGSDPCIYLKQHQAHTARLEMKKRRSHVRTSTSENEKSENTDADHLYWQPSREKQDSLLNKINHNAETSRGPCRSHVSVGDRVEQLNMERREKDSITQGVNFEAWNPNYEHSDNHQLDLTGETEAELRGTLKRIQRLVRVKKGGQGGAEEGKSSSEGHVADGVFGEGSPVVTCIGLSKKAEPSPRQQQAKDSNGNAGERPRSLGGRDRHWSPTEALPPPWEPCYHTCHAYHTCPQPWAEPWVYGLGWERFESLAQELDSKQSELALPRVVRSITDLDISESTPSTNFGRYDTFLHNSSLMPPEANGGALSAAGLGESGQTKRGSLGRKMNAISHMCKRMGRKYVTAQSAETSEETERGEEGEVKGGQTFAEGCRRSSDSLESLYSLNSGQSSSSGVTSGSGASSNRNSLRLEEDLPFAGQFCARARVHTEFVPSPYDTESLKLKVGDVIDVISKPPMGTWTGMLGDKVGNFKFIYADVLLEREPLLAQKMRSHSRSRRPRPRPLQELLEHLSLEEYASSLLLNGYRTVDDLTELREQRLTELSVTDPEHRRRLLAAVQSLRERPHDHQKGVEGDQECRSPRTNLNNYPRDSGCYIPSDCSHNSKEDTEVHMPSVHRPLAAI